ncbi:MAG: GGDEF domain-containing protein [Legionellaceae bacterium]|nr:GGDEF domain-containing protein [Legionellaceae bacterium]
MKIVNQIDMVINGHLFARRYRMTFVIGIETILLAIIIMTVFPEMHPLTNILVVMVAIILSISNLVLLYYYHCVNFSSHLLTFIVFATTVAINYFAGGTHSSLFIWIYMNPLIAATLTGFTGLLIYSGLSIVSILAFLWFPHTPMFEPPEHVLWYMDLMNLGFSILLILTVLLAFLLEIHFFEKKTLAQQKALEADRERLLHLSHHDSLTKLPNRKYFYEELGSRVNANTPFFIFYMDLNNFKPVNDNLGHEVGDQVLVETSKRLSNCFREQDFLARVGGDEFICIVSHDEDGDIANQIQKRIQNTFQHPYRGVNGTIILSIAIGIAYFPEDSDSIEVLLSKADSRMYQNKVLIKT